MKKISRILTFSALALTFAGCSDFDEINRDPQAVDESTNRPYYALNKSMMAAQQNPGVAERLFVINWAASARQDGQDGYGTSIGEYNDDHLSQSYNNMANTIKYAVDAINISTNQLAGELTDRDRQFFTNVKSFARIWRVYALSEAADSFGPMPIITELSGYNPEVRSVQDIYHFMYDELEEAINDIDVNVNPSDEEADCDAAYGYDASMWKAYGISLWMRLAMRLSEAEPDRAQQEFEAAVTAGNGIVTNDQIFSVQERSGWDDLSGVMSRSWNYQSLSATFANLTTNFGVPAEDVLKNGGLYTAGNFDFSRYEDKIKDAGTYLGRRFADHYLGNSDNPTKQYFFDGIPSLIDPRAFVYFFLPGDDVNRPETSDAAGNFQDDEAVRKDGMYDSESNELIPNTTIDARYTWNGLPAGTLAADQSVSYNGLIRSNHYVWCYPALAHKFRNNSMRRVFFGPWETYFLLAEAAVRGWDTGGITAKDAYEQGVTLSLEYNGMGSFAQAYLASESYNRVGTSVAFDHITEPSNYSIGYVDGYTGEPGTVVYEYPDDNNILYEGGKLNDQLTKIITQKYIANTPWLPLENLSDHRRLGLPFWEIPVSTLQTLTYMPEWTPTSYQGPQKPEYFVQRMPYPSSLDNTDPTGYARSLELLGGDDSRVTPLWWAIGGHE